MILARAGSFGFPEQLAGLLIEANNEDAVAFKGGQENSVPRRRLGMNVLAAGQFSKGGFSEG